MQTLTVMDVKTTLAQDCKHFNSTFRCMLFILSSLSETYILEFKFLVFTRFNMYFCKYTSLNSYRWQFDS